MQVINMDCVIGMRLLPDNYADAVVTDPPYELGFMGNGWDRSGIANSVEMWTEALRVLKPGGHLLAFSGSRTYHRMACAIEDAGFELRDQIMWVYGSGFPKSLDISKAIDKAAGAERPVIGTGTSGKTAGMQALGPSGIKGGDYDITAPATAAAAAWSGWGTALKPAHEPIAVARKPLAAGTVAANVLAYGTGGLNIDACRVGGEITRRHNRAEVGYHGGNTASEPVVYSDAGRWPANLMHDGSPEVVALFPDSDGCGGSVPNVKITGYGDGVVGSGKSEYFGGERKPFDSGSGSAARFFYCPKASKRDRGEGNPHPTVKPSELMRYLCRLVTPPGGLVLDPFAGSGSTGVAAALEGFGFLGFDLSAEFTEVANRRILAARNGA